MDHSGNTYRDNGGPRCQLHRLPGNNPHIVNLEGDDGNRPGSGPRQQKTQDEIRQFLEDKLREFEGKIFLILGIPALIRRVPSDSYADNLFSREIDVIPIP